MNQSQAWNTHIPHQEKQLIMWCYMGLVYRVKTNEQVRFNYNG